MTDVIISLVVLTGVVVGERLYRRWEERQIQKHVRRCRMERQWKKRKENQS